VVKRVKAQGSAASSDALRSGDRVGGLCVCVCVCVKIVLCMGMCM
jgi:hypothetical protein